MTNPANAEQPPVFQSRLDGSRPTDPPFNPSSYFLVGFFLGFVAVAGVALYNLTRLSASDSLRNRTLVAGGSTILVGIAFLIFAPTDWLDGGSALRLGARVIAIAGAGWLTWIHRGPAGIAAARSGEYTSMWRAIGVALVGFLIQSAILLVILGIRDAP